jgi:hypothetical protein
LIKDLVADVKSKFDAEHRSRAKDQREKSTAHRRRADMCWY